MKILLTLSIDNNH